MELKERAAYLKGLMEGLEISEETKEGKVLKAMYDLLADLCDTVADLDDDLDQVYDELDAMDEDMDELEEYVYGDDIEVGRRGRGRRRAGGRGGVRADLPQLRRCDRGGRGHPVQREDQLPQLRR